MESALGWIGQIVAWIGQFIPRWKVLDPIEGVVKQIGWSFRKDRRGPRAVFQRYGIVVWWPVVTEIYPHPVAEQTNDLPTQTIVTKDGKVFAARAVISYEITDLLTLLTTVTDPDDSIKDIAGGAVHEAIINYTALELEEANRNGELDRKMKSAAYHQLKSKGVKVNKVQLLELAPCRVFRLLNSEASDQFRLI